VLTAVRRPWLPGRQGGQLRTPPSPLLLATSLARGSHRRRCSSARATASSVPQPQAPLLDSMLLHVRKISVHQVHHHRSQPQSSDTSACCRLQASELTMVPLVPVAAGSRLIAPGRLFARLPQNLAPFVYEVIKILVEIC
jgi:hypothetical protein